MSLLFFGGLALAAAVIAIGIAAVIAAVQARRRPGSLPPPARGYPTDIAEGMRRGAPE